MARRGKKKKKHSEIYQKKKNVDKLKMKKRRRQVKKGKHIKGMQRTKESKRNDTEND